MSPAEEPVATSTRTAKGPPASLISRVNHLHQLLKNLPASLPLDPPDSASRYHFGLDPDEVEEEGIWFAFNNNLERCFETHALRLTGGVFQFTERGARLNNLVKLIKGAIKDLTSENDRNFLKDVWLERLIKAAELSGAKIPSKKGPKRKRAEHDVEDIQNSAAQIPAAQTPGGSDDAIIIDSSDEDEQPQPSKRKKTVKFAHDLLSDSEDESSQNVPNNAADAVALLSKGLDNPTRDQKTQPPVLKQKTFDDFRWKKLTPQEKDEQFHRELDELRARSEELRREDARSRELKAERQKSSARERQKKHRQLEKSKKADGAERQAKNKKTLLSHDVGAAELDDLAELSRPKSAWKSGRNGTKGGAVQLRHQRTNWYHPLLWTHINLAARKCHWSPQVIVSTLQRDLPALFRRLNRGTLYKWLNEDGNGWSDVTLANVARRHALAGSGKVGIFAKYPGIAKEISSKLKQYRESGVPVNVLVARSVILAVVKERQPGLLENFKCSEYFVRCLFESLMNWSPRKGTRAARHIPEDAPEQCERAFFRMVWLHNFERIPAKMWVNMDQQGNIVMGGDNYTFHDKGAKQVDIVGKDEKRAYTLCVASAAAGEFLPFQQVWSGATTRSLPKSNAEGMDKAATYGFDFAFAKSEKKTSHFSTLKTMKEWMENIYAPYIKSVIEADPELEEDQKSILILDCYPVHTGAKFREYVRETFPNVCLVYVPASCTPIFQPADVGLQRIIKHRLKQDALQNLVESHRRQLASGLTPEQVKFTTSLPVLRDASVQHLVNAYEFFSGPHGRDIVKSAWARCTAKEWNLSPESVTSKKALAAMRNYLRAHPDFREEIEARIGQPCGVEDDEEEQDAEDDPDNSDDSDIPSSAVIEKALGLNVPAADEGRQDCVASAEVTDGSNGLVASGDYENIWAYKDNGDIFVGIEEEGDDSEKEDGSNGTASNASEQGEVDTDLRIYALTEAQWSLAKNLVDILEIFVEVTDLFSRAEVPLVHEIIPIIERMEHQLVDVRDAKHGPLPVVIRIAAQAALLVIAKYYALTDENEVYRIAIAMCPHRKLEWFNKNPDWRAEDRLEADRVVRARWSETYAPKDTNAGGRQAVTAPAAPAKVNAVRSKWASGHRENEASSSRFPDDSIEAYLDSPPLNDDVINEGGGVLQYWERVRSSRPNLARMALDFLTAPASSVDAERSFSSGRLTVNHLQHNISSQSFKAQVALGSWYKTPLIPDTKTVARIIEAKLKGNDKGEGKGKGKGKAKEVIEVED